MRNNFLPLLGAFLLMACASDEPTDPGTPPPAKSPAGDAPAADSTSRPPADPSFAPLTSRAGAAGGSSVVAPGAIFTLPPAWIPETPDSSMRLAQARIPGTAGEGQLTVFYFGPGGGGGVDANLQRWIGQMELAPGTEPRREAFEAGAFRVTWIDVEGTLLPSTMGSGPDSPQPGSRMLAAVVEGPQGPWFFKVTGPAGTLAAEREAFLGVLRSGAPHG